MLYTNFSSLLNNHKLVVWNLYLRKQRITFQWAMNLWNIYKKNELQGKGEGRSTRKRTGQYEPTSVHVGYERKCTTKSTRYLGCYIAHLLPMSDELTEHDCVPYILGQFFTMQEKNLFLMNLLRWVMSRGWSFSCTTYPSIT